MPTHNQAVTADRCALCRQPGAGHFPDAEHQSLADAILDGADARAEDLMRRHFRHMKSAIMRLPGDSFA
ncbi:hypothetical protein [Streptomyces werraensis]|uniref:hypothetical protein n=1 Tax=Streptomyces werraensis TaxID=68284 RepID=UPI001CE2FB1E